MIHLVSNLSSHLCETVCGLRRDDLQGHALLGLRDWDQAASAEARLKPCWYTHCRSLSAVDWPRHMFLDKEPTCPLTA